MVYHRKLVAIVLLVMLCVTVVFSLSAGQYDLSFWHVAAWVCQQLGLPVFQDVTTTAQQEAVLMFIRAPRTVVALLVGAGLATSGAILQGLFSNPLADPGIIGVSSGATVGAVVAISLGLNTISMFALPVMAFAGAGISGSAGVYVWQHDPRSLYLLLRTEGFNLGTGQKIYW